MFSLNQELLSSQHKIAVLERERSVLYNKVKDKNYKLVLSTTFDKNYLHEYDCIDQFLT